MSNESIQESFVSHLVELRSRLVKAVVSVLAVTFALMAYPGMKTLYAWVAAPMLAVLPQGTSMIATDVTGTFFIPLKVTLMAGFLISLPIVLYQMWAFVAPGLYKHEKKLALPIIVSSTLLFFCGMAFAYFVVFPSIFGTFVGFTPAGVNMTPDIDKYWSFALTMFIAFGLTFETPVVLAVLTRAGIVTVAQLKEFRGYFIVAAFVIAAVVTPPDVLSQLFLAVPLVILYEVGIWVSTFITPRKRSDEDAAAA
ncbi:MAG: twin-arginine translocase subunit TatC [Betaproteobacteria bacterium]|nr:MAG: twin-arginine translocase subunit TatC [Betaproteobacteria bacterium]TAG43854.1 MAG: twin-arginine translocase subunit TatC [Betaproteobacteria bacterium]